MMIRHAYNRILSWTIAALVLSVAPATAQSTQELPLGSSMPMAGTSFADVNGGQQSLSALEGANGTAVVFWSNQCPWVERYESRFNGIVTEFSERGIGFVLVNSNDAESYPRESAAESASRFERGGYPPSVTYLSDPGSDLAEAFGAERTPHVYLFDADGMLVYVGTIDDSPGDPGSVGEEYLRDALDAVVTGSDVTVPQTKAFGCMIKFKS